MKSAQHVERRITAAVTTALTWSPVVAITGARTAGRSTLAHEITARYGGSFVDLDVRLPIRPASSTTVPNRS